MWIETTNTDSAGKPVTKRVRKPGTDDEYVTLSENGKAQVTSDVGEQLLAEFDSLVSSSDEDSEDGDETTDDTDDS